MKIKYCLVLFLVISLASVFLTISYMKSRIQNMPLTAPHKESHPIAPPLITTAHPSLHTFTLRVPWIGTVEPGASVELTSLAAARVISIEAEDQDLVKEGQLVIRLGGPQTDELRARLTTEIESLKTQLDFATQTAARLELNLKAQLATRDQVAAAQDTKVKIEAQLREAQLNFAAIQNQIRISSPVNGIFTNRRVSVGQSVNAGQVVGEIIDTRHLRIIASIFPPQGLELKGREVTIRLDEKRNLAGSVRRVLPIAGSTGSVMVWIESPQIDEQLHPGQTVSGSMAVRVNPEALAVPESAIVYGTNETPYLFVRNNNSYESHPVRLGLIQDGWAQVLSGIKQDQFVVIQGNYELYYRQFNEQFKVQD